MATTLRVQATWHSASLMPEDGSTNVWHFRTVNSDPEGDRTAIIGGLASFYSQIAPLTTENTLGDVVTLKFYDLQDDPPRSLLEEHHILDLSTGTGDGIPTECAITMSFEGALISGTSRARRRGRVYLGPFNTGVTTTITGFVRVSIAAMEVIRDAAQDLVESGFPNYVWAVFSPTAAGAQPWSDLAIEQATTNVDHGWIDDAFDTQRRRGTQPDTRVTFAV